MYLYNGYKICISKYSFCKVGLTVRPRLQKWRRVPPRGSTGRSQTLVPGSETEKLIIKYSYTLYTLYHISFVNITY